MADDLVKRLKGHSEIMERDKGRFVRFIDVATCTEAADRIERLEAALLMIAIPRVGGGQWASEIARKVMGIGDDA